MEIKKNPRKDVYRLRSMLFNVGLLLSTLLVLMAFEWRTYHDKVEIDSLHLIHYDKFDPPVTILEPPKPRPKPVLPKPVEVKNDESIDDDPVIFDMPQLDDIQIPELPDIEDEPVDDGPIIADWVEQMPEPEGGYDQFYRFIKENIKYPAPARKLGVEGKVFVQFIVDPSGNITDVEIIRGIGAGCDEEVMRLMKKAPGWKPGKQRGKPVKVRMVIPINFQLSN